MSYNPPYFRLTVTEVFYFVDADEGSPTPSKTQGPAVSTVTSNIATSLQFSAMAYTGTQRYRASSAYRVLTYREAGNQVQELEQVLTSAWNKTMTSGSLFHFH